MKQSNLKRKSGRSLYWLLPCMLLMMVGVVCAEDWVGKNSNGGTLERWTDGVMAWSTTSGGASGATIIDIGPDGNVYATNSNGGDVIKWDGATGDFVENVVNNIGHRAYGLCFGPDVDGDGISDMYVFGGADATVKSFTSSSGYTEQGSWIATVTDGAWIGDFGPDVNGDGFPELYVNPVILQNTSNVITVIDGADPSTELYTFAIPLCNRPGNVIGGSDGRIYIQGRKNDTIASYLPDGTDGLKLVGSEAANFPTQIDEGKPGEWVYSNRFAVGTEVGASIMGSTDSLVTVSVLLNYGDDTADSWGCMANFEDGMSGRGQVQNPDPATFAGGVDSTVVSSVSWDAPAADPNITVDGYDVYWSLNEDPNYLEAPIDNGTALSFTPTGDDAIDYGTVYVWRVDTRVTWDSNEITGNFNDVLEGQQYYFVTKPAYVPPTIAVDHVITTMDLLPATLSGSVADGEAVTSVSWTVTESPDGATWALPIDTTTDMQNPTGSLDPNMPGTYMVQLETDDGTTILQATAQVDVYADACDAAKATGERTASPYDFNDDCIVNLEDFADVAAAWLESTELTAQHDL